MQYVSIIKIKNDNEIEKAVEHAIKLIGGINKFIKKGEKVLIKPNVCSEKKFTTGITTHPKVIRAVVKQVLKAGAKPIVGESSIIGHSTMKSFEISGIKDALKGLKVKIIDLNTLKSRRVKIPNAIRKKEITVSEGAVKVDRIISIPVLKTHMKTLVSLSLKNMKGIEYGREKTNNHMAGLEETIVDLNKRFKPDLSIISGIIGHQGNGPTNGKPIKANLIIAGRDPVAVDTVGTILMGFNPKKVKHIKLAAEQGLGTNDIHKIKILGTSLNTAKTNFIKPISYRLPLGTKIKTLRNIIRKVLRKRMPEPYIAFDHDKCRLCLHCKKICPVKAIKLQNKKMKVDNKKCVLCLCCHEACPYNAIKVIHP